MKTLSRYQGILTLFALLVLAIPCVTQANIAAGKPIAYQDYFEWCYDPVDPDDPDHIPVLYNSPALAIDGDAATTFNYRNYYDSTLEIDLEAEYIISQVKLVGSSEVGNNKALSRFSHLKVQIIDEDGATLIEEKQVATPYWVVGFQPSVTIDFTDPCSMGRYIRVARTIGSSDPNVVGEDFNALNSVDAAGKTYDTGLSLAEIEVYVTLPSEGTANTAHTPDPNDGESLVSDTTELSWSAPIAYTPEYYDIYLDPNESKVSASDLDCRVVATYLTDPCYIPGIFDPNVTYYWKVIAYEPNEPNPPIPHEGPVWSFTTVPTEPTITQQPVSQLVEAEGDVEFEITAVASEFNPIETYQWYSDGGDGIPDSGDDVAITGETSSTLILYDVVVYDEGQYYCKAENSVGVVYSEMATLEVKRLKGHYEFEGNLSDSTSNGYDGTMVHSPVYSNDPCCIQGSACLLLSGSDDPNDLVSVDPNVLGIIGQEITVSFWIKNNSEQYQSVVYGGGSGGSVVNVQAPWNGSTFVWESGNPDDGTDFAYYTDTESGWIYVACTTETGGGECKLYLNGALKATGSASKLIAGATDMWFGKNVDGLLDDLKIYNYALSATEIGQEYVDMTGATICLTPYNEADINEDCEVDLNDLALLGQNWLISNSVTP